MYLNPHRHECTSMPVSIVIIGKGGEVRETRATDVECSTLARKCGLKKPKGFARRAAWQRGDGAGGVVELWARTEGNAGSENKYDFPPPADNMLFFGACCLVAKSPSSGAAQDLVAESWASTYERLFGGFENIDESEESSEDELASVPKEMKTRNGYLKDGFVTDGEEESEDDGEDEEESAQSGSPLSSSCSEPPLESEGDEAAELEEEEYSYGGGGSRN